MANVPLEEIPEMVDISEKDEERRVEGLKVSSRSLLDSIGKLSNLSVLTAFITGLALPASIGDLKNLNALYLNSNHTLENLPDEIGNLSSLKVLDISNTSISSLPSSIGRLQNLQELSLSGNKK